MNCCRRREGFGNVRRPCTAPRRVVRREGFGNVRRPRRIVRRRRERFGDCTPNSSAQYGCSGTCDDIICPQQGQRPTCFCNGPDCAAGMGQCKCTCI